MKRPKISLAFVRKKWFFLPMSLVVLPLFCFYMGFVNYTEPTEIGIARNVISGNMWIQEEGGYHITPPWVWVTVLDLRPMRVSITSGGRGYSSKLVQFQKEYWEEFVEVEGWRWYWWSNRFSINFGYSEEYRGFRDIMRGYAYSAKSYPFIVVLGEYETQ